MSLCLLLMFLVKILQLTLGETSFMKTGYIFILLSLRKIHLIEHPGQEVPFKKFLLICVASSSPRLPGSCVPQPSGASQNWAPPNHILSSCPLPLQYLFLLFILVHKIIRSRFWWMKRLTNGRKVLGNHLQSIWKQSLADVNCGPACPLTATPPFILYAPARMLSWPWHSCAIFETSVSTRMKSTVFTVL